MVPSSSLYPSPRLTRSCNACVRSKRKCSLEQPACQRCHARQLTCTYVNEPLNTVSEDVPTQHSDLTANFGSGESFSTARNLVTALKGVSSSLKRKPEVAHHDSHEASNDAVSALGFMRLPEPICQIEIDPNTLSFMTQLAKRHVFSYAWKGQTVFIHDQVSNGIISDSLTGICRRSSSKPFRRHKRRGDIVLEVEAVTAGLKVSMDRAVTIHDVLEHVQCLILLQIICLIILNPSSYQRQQAEARQHRLTLWTQKLWEAVPAELPNSLSPQSAFLLAESIRRTIIVSAEIRGLYHAMQHGWILHNSFLDTLPFERRASLWDASSQEFDSVFTSKGKEKQNLVSWREFADTFDGGAARELTSFETMLLVGAKSKPALEACIGHKVFLTRDES